MLLLLYNVAPGQIGFPTHLPSHPDPPDVLVPIPVAPPVTVPTVIPNKEAISFANSWLNDFAIACVVKSYSCATLVAKKLASSINRSYVFVKILFNDAFIELESNPLTFKHSFPAVIAWLHSFWNVVKIFVASFFRFRAQFNNCSLSTYTLFIYHTSYNPCISFVILFCVATILSIACL